MKQKITIQVNGESRPVESDPERSLLDVLREDLHLTGTKYGCGEGQCRACTVLLDGKPTQSCITPVTAAEGAAVQTIEGVGTETELDPVQQAFIDEEAMQCGYCVPGMILAAKALLARNAEPTDAEIAQGINGNICRCCGYPSILKAVKRAAALSRKEVSA